MKVQATVRSLYEAQYSTSAALKKHVDNTFLSGKPTRWHYESRLKELNSFAAKLETGRVRDPAALEDFLACSIVVPNSSMIRDADLWVRDRFNVSYQRPEDPAVTKKFPDAFPFDDLRLYCIRGNDGSRPEEIIDQLVFEVQIKTFLQHAWGIATHDLSYKTDDVRWGKDRVVSHLKAAIEFAELSLQEADTLSHSSALQLNHRQTTETSNIISLLNNYWNRDELPENLRGMAETIRSILQESGLKIDQLKETLDREFVKSGSMPSNLSPYGAIIQSLMKDHFRAIERMLKGQRSRVRLFLTSEIELPEDIKISEFRDRIIGPV
jgi:hypothetical protein